MYGVYDPTTKTWNGIVRELMERVSNRDGERGRFFFFDKMIYFLPSGNVSVPI